MVHVEAERSHTQAGWKATRVDVTDKWIPGAVQERKVRW